MPAILSVETSDLPYELPQDQTMEFAKELFSESFNDIERLLKVFANGDIRKRNFSEPMEWFKDEHTFGDRNARYIENATTYSVKGIEGCLASDTFLKRTIHPSEVDAIIFVSSTGMSTPSLDARIMNKLPFRADTKRIPLWGLGCAGGAAGLSRGYEYCLAYPESSVLVVCVELCGLTFQKDDHSKSNLIGTSLFADGVACALLSGDQSALIKERKQPNYVSIQSSQSTLMPDSEDVMGWDVQDNGLNVVFSRSIPSIVANWLEPVVTAYLEKEQVALEEIDAFIAHPGGKKVLEAYEKALKFSSEKTDLSRQVLREHGNMSSPTVLYVLKACMEEAHHPGEKGLIAALGPGFCSEMLLVEWKGELA
ncbi:type III polyketide synthase [Alkalihalobacillus sp. LMS6]|uniref:type III polyketide synthase n=1 Tax=Alkalihalobacillus sp. LMS6 TaxID=2924034 RepID=UPI0020D0D45E|nr:3-oxoacyl-[acyl-carrier-protein] synthase III C-terminal domain-containing protein [Alkalihalobacillus sp. LMS6]UTR07469.1 type III polyketide synthase [Alkalihalobacillus sp. LMS6]